MHTIAIGLVLAGLALVLSLFFCAGVMRSGVVDHPDGDRKTQAEAVPRLGGVAIALSFVIIAAIAMPIILLISGIDLFSALSAGFVSSIELAARYKSLLLFIIAVFCIGLWDDMASPPSWLKLLLLLAICGLAAMSGLMAESLTTPLGTLDMPLILIVGSALWLLVFTNAANFMDGANGLSIGCLTLMITGLALCAATASNSDVNVWLFPLLGAVAGFLLHNLKGRLYAGDAGALGLGGAFAAVGLTSGLEVWTIATIALPFLVDVLMTLIWRAKHRRSWLQPHTDHAYQKLRLAGWSHVETATVYWGLTIVCGVAAYIGIKAGGYAPFGLFFGLLVAGILVWRAHRRTID